MLLLQVESLENQIHYTQTEGQRDVENCMNRVRFLLLELRITSNFWHKTLQIELLRKESKHVENCNENLERLTRVIHSLTQLPAPTSDRLLVERVEDILEEERKRGGSM